MSHTDCPRCALITVVWSLFMPLKVKHHSTSLAKAIVQRAHGATENASKAEGLNGPVETICRSCQRHCDAVIGVVPTK